MIIEKDASSLNFYSSLVGRQMTDDRSSLKSRIQLILIGRKQDIDLKQKKASISEKSK